MYDWAKIHYILALSFDPSFAHARIALAAVNSLAGIFRGETEKKVPEEAGPQEISYNVPKAMDPAGPRSSVQPGDNRLPAHREEPGTGNIRQEIHQTPPVLEEEGSRNAGQSTPPPLAPLQATATLIKGRSLPAEKPVDVNSLQRVEVEISNGNGVPRMAKGVGNYLNKQGIKVGRLTNADHFSYRRTKIYYQKGYRGVASQVADMLPTEKNLEERRNLDRPNIKVKVRIGKDAASRRGYFQEG